MYKKDLNPIKEGKVKVLFSRKNKETENEKILK